MTARFVSFEEGAAKLNWIGLTKAIEAGHKLPKAEIGDTFLYRGGDTLLSRAAWIDGLGSLVKTATIYPGNPNKGQSSINGAVSLFDDATGVLSAMIDFHLVTKWKTAGDSLLGALKLARPESRKILIIGAGTVAASLREAYGAGFPDAEFKVWNRTRAHAEEFAESQPATSVADDLEAAVRWADIVTSAVMVRDPILKGDWFGPGQHIDLIGAYRPDMREADDATLQKARVFVDAFDTTVGHIGEVQIPLDSGAITRDHLLADYYDIGAMRRESDDDITLFKNGGGAHLDLMTSRHILDVCS